MTCIEPFIPRKYSKSETARLQALRPLADEIAETVLAHIERERCIVKDQIARKIHFELLGARATVLWEDPPGTVPVRKADAMAEDQPIAAPRSPVHVVTREERWIIAEALREKAVADVKLLDKRRGVTVVGRLRNDLRRWSADAERLAQLIDAAAIVDIWPVAPMPGP